MAYNNNVKDNSNSMLIMTNSLISKVDYNDLPVLARIVYETGKNGCYRGQDTLIPNANQSEIISSINNLERHNFIKVYVNNENTNETIIIPSYDVYTSFVSQYKKLERNFISIPDNYVQRTLKHDFVGITVSSNIKSIIRHDMIPLLYNYVEFSKKHPSEVFDPFNNTFDDFKYLKDLTKDAFIYQLSYLVNNKIIEAKEDYTDFFTSLRNPLIETTLSSEFSRMFNVQYSIQIPYQYFKTFKSDYNSNPIRIKNSAEKIVDQNKDKEIYIPEGVQEIVNYKYWTVLSQIVELTKNNGRFSSYDSLLGLLNLERHDLIDSLKYLYFNGFIHVYMKSYKNKNETVYRTFLTIDHKIDDIYNENSLYVHEPTIRPGSTEITFGHLF